MELTQIGIGMAIITGTVMDTGTDTASNMAITTMNPNQKRNVFGKRSLEKNEYYKNKNRRTINH